MNISELSNKIYGLNNLKQGEYINFKQDFVEQQELRKLAMNGVRNNYLDNELNRINKEIKF